MIRDYQSKERGQTSLSVSRQGRTAKGREKNENKDKTEKVVEIRGEEESLPGLGLETMSTSAGLFPAGETEFESGSYDHLATLTTGRVIFKLLNLQLR